MARLKIVGFVSSYLLLLARLRDREQREPLSPSEGEREKAPQFIV
jgi:hypothetical protein